MSDRVSQDAIGRFKNAFLGTMAQSEMPLLSHKVRLPEFLIKNEGVAGILAKLETDLDNQVNDIPNKRAGTTIPIIGKTISRQKTSSLSKTGSGIGNQVDTDILENVSKGKGRGEAKAALKNIKAIEKQLQQATTEQLLANIDEAIEPENLASTCDYLKDTRSFAMEKGCRDGDVNDQHVMGLAGVLAGLLNMKPKQFLKMKGSELFSLYTERVVAYMNVARKVPLKSGETKKDGPEEIIYTLVCQLREQPLQVLSEDATKIVQLMNDANITNDFALKQARAGKFTTGGVEPEKIELKSKDGNSSFELSLDGNKRYNKATKKSLDAIGKTPEGKLLFESLTQSGRPVSIHPPSISSAQRIKEDGEMDYMNTGGTEDVAFDPENVVTGADDSDELLDEQPWLKRDPSIALYHELIHTLIGNNGDNEEWTATDGMTKLTLTSTGERTELRVVGIDFELELENGEKALFPWSDPKYNPISENAYRCAFAKTNKLKQAVLRPEYVANMKGQKKMDTHLLKM